MAERSAAATTVLVLATVNAPYREQLDAQRLAKCLRDHAAAKAKPGHVSSFFGEVTPELQIAFARLFGISHAELAAAAKAFALYSGESYPLAE
jgi:hypothetical protein